MVLQTTRTEIRSSHVLLGSHCYRSDGSPRCQLIVGVALFEKSALARLVGWDGPRWTVGAILATCEDNKEC